MRLGMTVLVVMLVLGMAYVRLAPSDPTRWHVAIRGEGDADFPAGARRVVEAAPEALAVADGHMRALPRTRLLAGSVGEGRMTYITRTLIFGFPDYTTLEHDGVRLKAFARLRFGKSDMGVNRKRLERLVAEIERR